MITFSRLGFHGQLGNQLFQYALLRSVSHARGFELRLPVRPTHPKKNGLTELECFNISYKPLTDRDRILSQYEETSFAYSPAVFDVEDGTDFYGYFQSERYFASIAPVLREELAFREEIAVAADGYLRPWLIEGGELVAVHVRRGDFLQSRAHHVCDVSYYRAGMELVGNARSIFVVCSDDVDWCRQNLRGKGIVYCAVPCHWTTLAIMSRCHHQIISASTYGWWAAWLNSRPEKVIVAPTQWFGRTLRHLDTSDLIPSTWIRL